MIKQSNEKRNRKRVAFWQLSLAVCADIMALPRHGPWGSVGLLALQVLVVGHLAVDELAVGGEVEHPVGHGLHQLVVVGGEEHVALDGLQAVVQGGDGLQIQVVGGLVQQ